MTEATFPAPVAPAGSDRIVRFAFILTAALLAIRLALSGQFELFFDEAYYWLWSTQLQPAYYDHPGMVAVMIRAGTMLFGDTEFGVRFFGNLSVTGCALLVYAIAYTLFGDRRMAAWALIFMNVNLVAVLLVVTLPDQAMLLFWLGAVYAGARIAKGGSGAWWLVAGLLGGLAAASKFVTFFLALAFPLWLIVVPGLRRWFRSPWLYGGVGLALLVFLPVLLWNAGNDWISLTFQFSRAQFQFDEPSVASFLQYLVTTPLVATPPIFILAVAGTIALLRSGWRRDPGPALLLLAPVPLALYLGYHSFREAIGIHWVAPMVAIAAILAAIGLDHIGPGWFGRLARFSARAAVPLGLGISALFFVATVEKVLPVPRSLDFTARFRGFEALAENAEASRQRKGADYLLVGDYSLPAYFRFYLGRDTPAYQRSEFLRWSYFDGLGTAPAAFAEGTGLYVGRWSLKWELATISRYFGTVYYLGDTVRPIRDGQLLKLPTFLVSDPLPLEMPLFGAPMPPEEPTVEEPTADKS